MSVWTICACFEARSEAESKKPSKQAHKCVSKKIENISRRFADCFAINSVPKWSVCKSTLQAMSFEQFWQLLANNFLSCFDLRSGPLCARPSCMREPAVESWEGNFRSHHETLFAPLLGEEIPAICRPREQIEKSRNSLSAQTSIYWMKISWDLISNVHASKSISAMSFSAPPFPADIKTSNENCLMILTLTFFALSQRNSHGNL